MESRADCRDDYVHLEIYGVLYVLLLAGITSISSDIYERAELTADGNGDHFFPDHPAADEKYPDLCIIQGMIGSLQLVEDPMTLLTGWISGGQSAVAGGPDRSSLT